MHEQLATPTIRDRREGRAVASYTDARGAVLAVDALRQHGFVPDAVAIQPGSMSLMPEVLRRTRLAPEWFAPSMAALTTFIGVVWWRGASLGAVLLALIVAALTAGLVRLLDLAARRVSRRRFARAARTIVAERFDVVVAVRDDEAEHLLATWSDPDAWPARIERRAA